MFCIACRRLTVFAFSTVSSVCNYVTVCRWLTFFIFSSVTSVCNWSILCSILVNLARITSGSFNKSRFDSLSRETDEYNRQCYSEKTKHDLNNRKKLTFKFIYIYTYAELIKYKTSKVSVFLKDKPLSMLGSTRFVIMIEYTCTWLTIS
jgi:hypothetical protein